MPTSTAFDALFDKYRGNVPTAYLRALAMKESGMDPKQIAPGGGGHGLLQITDIVRRDFNQRHSAGVTTADLLTPTVSVQLAADLLNRIVTAYGKHPSPTMRAGDWTNPEFVKLVTMGWNAGFSEGGGVGKVVGYLESHGLPVTHDNVYRYASAAGGVAKLGNTSALNWQRGVLSLFRQQPDWKGAAAAGLGTVLVLVGLGALAVKLKLFS